MRICTRDAVNVSYDATIPAKPVWQEAYSSTEHCASSEKDVPWSMDDSNIADPGMFSAGNAPMWRGNVWDAAGLYPDANRLREINNTSPGLRSQNAWNAGCLRDDLKDVITCTQDSDCVSLFPGTVRLECFRNICILNRLDTDTCYSHADCESKNEKLCAGDGRCVHSVLQVENALEEDIDFELYSEACSSSNASKFPTVQYDTYGASPWEKIPDVLSMYGMCSYR